jgi:maltose O-acetyltransferase
MIQIPESLLFHPEARRIFRDVYLNRIVAGAWVPSQLRWILLRFSGADVRRSYILPGCFFGGRTISIGKGTFINYDCFFDCADIITIGARVRIGMKSTFVTGSHEIAGPYQRAGSEQSGPISIGDGTWIGASVTVLPGVAIGVGAVVAAGAVVVRDVAPNTLVAGVPATFVRFLPSAEIRHGDQDDDSLGTRGLHDGLS